jgi:CRP-like cAMP-binding protein
MQYGATYAARQRSESAKCNALLSALPAKDFSLLAPYLRTVALERGAVLRDLQEEVECVYFPFSGMVSRFAVMRNGATAETEMIGRTGIVGFMAGLGLCRATGRAVVQIPGEAARIAASQFTAVVKESVALRDLLVGYTGLVLAQTQQCVACNALHGLEPRLCRWLLHADDCLDGDPVPLTQELIAQMLGVRRTTLTVVARLLQAADMIRYRRGLVHIINRSAVEQSACECYNVIKRYSDNLFSNIARSESAEILSETSAPAKQYLAASARAGRTIMQAKDVYKPEDGAFDPEITASMAAALDDVCRALKVNGNERERQVLATRITDLARNGEHNRFRLRERVLLEASRADDVLDPVQRASDVRQWQSAHY